jgi:hypothetical protein
MMPAVLPPVSPFRLWCRLATGWQPAWVPSGQAGSRPLEFGHSVESEVRQTIGFCRLTSDRGAGFSLAEDG